MLSLCKCVEQQGQYEQQGLRTVSDLNVRTTTAIWRIMAKVGGHWRKLAREHTYNYGQAEEEIPRNSNFPENRKFRNSCSKVTPFMQNSGTPTRTENKSETRNYTIGRIQHIRIFIGRSGCYPNTLPMYQIPPNLKHYQCIRYPPPTFSITNVLHTHSHQQTVRLQYMDNDANN